MVYALTREGSLRSVPPRSLPQGEILNEIRVKLLTSAEEVITQAWQAWLLLELQPPMDIQAAENSLKELHHAHSKKQKRGFAQTLEAIESSSPGDPQHLTEEEVGAASFSPRTAVLTGPWWRCWTDTSHAQALFTGHCLAIKGAAWLSALGVKEWHSHKACWFIRPGNSSATASVDYTQWMQPCPTGPSGPWNRIPSPKRQRGEAALPAPGHRQQRRRVRQVRGRDRCPRRLKTFLGLPTRSEGRS